MFEVEPESVSSFRSKDANYWGVANGNDTMFTLWNPTDAPQDILVTFHYGDGSGQYKLPVHLGPQASTTIDMAMLIAENKPDPDGNVIPSNIREGSAQFASAKGRTETINLVIAAGIYNVSTATCGGGCINCCGGSNFGISPNPIFCPIGETMPCSSTAVDCNGYSFGPSSWSSSNTAVMTVDSSGNVHGVAAGSATITATFRGSTVYTGQMCGGNGCPTASPAPGAPANTTPTISSLLPSTGTVGKTLTVVITGSGFSTTLANNTVQAGSGIAVTVVSVSTDGTTINASFAIAPNAPIGSSGVTVTVKASDGSTVPSNTVNFTLVAVAIPTDWTILSEAPLNSGALFFRYVWYSSTGAKPDLSTCSVGETVFYPNYPNTPYIWPLPMVSSTTNPSFPPTGKGSDALAEDTNSPPDSYQQPYSATSPFTATQRWWWSCPYYNNGSQNNFVPDLPIIRKVFKDTDGFWKYQITKSGYTNTVKLPNQ